MFKFHDSSSSASRNRSFKFMLNYSEPTTRLLRRELKNLSVGKLFVLINSLQVSEIQKQGF
jgi:hypothetical protein